LAQFNFSAEMMKMAAQPRLLDFDNTYAALPERLYARQPPVPVAEPRLLLFNEALADDLRVARNGLSDSQWASIWAGNTVLAGAAPLAMAYAGHQYGQFVPSLGDGRALLLGEVLDKHGERYDIQLKGSGVTPFSRRGDGRAALGPVLREYLVSETMHSFGVPTTRALAAVTTGERVLREQALPGAVLTRVARSHVRVGTFQYFAARGDLEAVRVLADYVSERHYPQTKHATNPALALLDAVLERQALLMAHWLNIGFVHGVMNTDNMAIAGETIDYGPCAFMDAYDPQTVFSSIDHYGRYAYGNQPVVAQWNLTRLAETLVPLIDADENRAVAQAKECLESFVPRFEAYWLAGMRRKLGLVDERDTDKTLVDDLLELMRDRNADFTLTFRYLSRAADPSTDAGEFLALLGNTPPALAWLERWQQRLHEQTTGPQERAQAMYQVNPAFIPRNHRIEQALTAAVEQGDLGPFETLRRILAQPYTEQPEYVEYMQPPQPNERVYQTFCGT